MRYQNLTKLDDLDRSIVGALRRNGRATNVQIGRALGVTEKTIRTRITRLVDKHGLRISAEIDEPPAAVQMMYLVDAQAGRRFHLAEELAAHPAVDQVLLVNGAAELMVRASFPEVDAALRFLVTSIEGSPDVRSAVDCTIISQVGTRSRASDPRVPHISEEILQPATFRPPTPDSLEEILSWMCRTAAQAFGADHSLSLIYPPTIDHENPSIPDVLGSASFGLSNGYLERVTEGFQKASNLGVVRRCLDTRQHVFVDDTLRSPLLAGVSDQVNAEGYRSLLAVPILFGALPFGVTVLYFDRSITIDERYVASVQRFIDQCALMIARFDSEITERLDQRRQFALRHHENARFS